MIKQKRLVLLVEGEGDRTAAPVLVKRVLTDLNAWDCLTLDNKPPMIVGEIGGLIKNKGEKWKKYLEAARRTRPNLGAVLLLLDGDPEKILGQNFCARDVARYLAGLARDAGAEKLFSVAVVFACQEFESWILTCADRIAGLNLADGRPGVRAETIRPQQDLEKRPRNAKGLLGEKMEFGYNPVRDQGPALSI